MYWGAKSARIYAADLWDPLFFSAALVVKENATLEGGKQPLSIFLWFLCVFWKSGAPKKKEIIGKLSRLS